MSKQPTSQQQLGRALRAAGRGDAQRLRELVAHLQMAREADFRRIVAVLHDDILSPLVGVTLDLGASKDPWHARDFELSKACGVIVQRVQTVMKAAAQLQAELTPPLLKHCGLGAVLSTAAQEWADNHSGGCRFIGRSSQRDIAQPLALELFRIFQETLVSVGELSGRMPLEIELTKIRQSWRLRIRVQTRRRHAARTLSASLPLQCARERARRLGGNLSVRRTASFVSLSFIIPHDT